MKTPAKRPSRDGWNHKTDHQSVQIDGKQYRDMREWTRPCVVCNGDVTAFEKIDAADINSRFGMKTCPAHRGLMPAFERGFIAWDASAKRLIPGTAITGTFSRPTVITEQPIAAILTPAELTELESLRMYKNTVSEELKELDSLRRENHALKTQLGGGLSTQNTTTERLRREFLAKLEREKKEPVLITGGFIPGAPQPLELHDTALDTLRQHSTAKLPWTP